MATNLGFNSDTSKFSRLETPSAPPFDDAPPNYFDISIVPNTAILYKEQSVPIEGQSMAEIERTRKGVVSFDELIDRNPDQMWLYFMTYLNEKPRLNVEILGYYTEYYTTTETTRDADGNTRTETVQQSRTVTEFSFTIDLSPYISDVWWRVAVIPSNESRGTGGPVTLRTAIEQYTMSNKKIKSIDLRKQISGWNLDELKGKLLAIVRSTGYSNDVNIIFQWTNFQISAQSSSQLNRFANSTLVRVLCVLTCLCVIFGPIYCCLRAAGSVRDKVVAEYLALRPVNDFLQLNSQLIFDSVNSRSYATFLACIR